MPTNTSMHTSSTLVLQSKKLKSGLLDEEEDRQPCVTLSAALVTAPRVFGCSGLQRSNKAFTLRDKRHGQSFKVSSESTKQVVRAKKCFGEEWQRHRPCDETGLSYPTPLKSVVAEF